MPARSLSDLSSPAPRPHARFAEAMKLPHVTPRVPHAKAAWASRHPKERHYVVRSVVWSIAIHVLVGALVCVAAYWLMPKDLFSKSSSSPSSGPAPEQPVTVNLVMGETPIPPRTPAPKPNSEPGLPVLEPIPPIPKPPVAVSVPSPPKPSPKPVPEPVPPILTAEVVSPVLSPAKHTPKPSEKAKPKYTAAQATGQGNALKISSAQLATLGLPAPDYPVEARALNEVGTVMMEVAFGANGKVRTAEVLRSSGFSMLDFSTRSFIRVHWKDPSRANTTVDVPIIYHLEN